VLVGVGVNVLVGVGVSVLVGVGVFVAVAEHPLLATPPDAYTYARLALTRTDSVLGGTGAMLKPLKCAIPSLPAVRCCVAPGISYHHIH